MYIAQLNHTYYYSKLITLKKQTMKHFFKLTCAAAFITAGIITLSIFNKEKKLTTKGDYSVQQVSNSTEPGGSSNNWTLVHNDPNPGNGDISTLQDVRQ